MSWKNRTRTPVKDIKRILSRLLVPVQKTSLCSKTFLYQPALLVYNIKLIIKSSSVMKRVKKNVARGLRAWQVASFANAFWARLRLEAITTVFHALLRRAYNRSLKQEKTQWERERVQFTSTKGFVKGNERNETEEEGVVGSNFLESRSGVSDFF